LLATVPRSSGTAADTSSTDASGAADHKPPIERPLFVGHGANRGRLEPRNEEVERALRARGIGPTYLRHPDDGRPLARGANRMPFDALAEPFFAACLGGRGPRVNSWAFLLTSIVGELPVSQRTSFNSPHLIRLLADLDVVGAAPSKQSLAEGISPWLAWTDAISLSTVLCPPKRAVEPEQPRKVFAASRGAAVIEHSNRVRSDLARAITADPLFAAGEAGTTRRASRDAATAAMGDEEPDFSPYRSRYIAHQRAMERRIATLRADLRAALQAASAELGGLAALDAVLDEALGARERELLSTVPRLLGKHFERRRQAAAPACEGEPGPAEAGGRAVPWLAVFSRQMQSVLLAELDIRLHPVEGMIEALQTHTGANAMASASNPATVQP